MSNQNKVPLITAKFNVFVDGGTSLFGIAECTLPSFEAMSETFSGAGVAGEIDVPVIGQFSAGTLTMNFVHLYGQPSELAVTKTYNFDLRSALEINDKASHELGIIQERYAIRGPVKKVDPGKLGKASASDASVEVAVYRQEHWIDGKQVLEWDALNEVYVVNGNDIYAPVREAIGG